MEPLECDLLVLGAGMAGLTAGARAARGGARVIVVEKTGAIGGSAVLSGAMFWTLQSVEKLAYVTQGRPDLLALLLDGYRAMLDWLREREISVSASLDVMNGQGYEIDIIAYLQDCVRLIEQAGGYVVFDSDVIALTRDEDGRVTGGIVSHADGDIAVTSPWTILATGGMQGDPEMRARHVGPEARDMLLRSNAASVGEGVRLGLAVGGTVPDNDGFYGHLIPEGTPWGEPKLFRALAQHHSAHCLLVNQAGTRFCDESRYDHVNNQAVLRQPGSRALMIWDDAVHKAHVLLPFLVTHETVDRLEVALGHGAKAASFASLEALALWADAAGFDGAAAVRTVADYNRDLSGAWQTLSPAREAHHELYDRAPFHAMVVRPAITFSFGGLSVDAQARVLDVKGAPIPGLLAAGADAGDMFRTGYAGGLAQATGTAIAAARTTGFGAQVIA